MIRVRVRAPRPRVLTRLSRGLRAERPRPLRQPRHPRRPDRTPLEASRTSGRPGRAGQLQRSSAARGAADGRAGRRLLRSPSGSLRSRGVDLTQLAGSGPGGRIVKADVEAGGFCRGWRGCRGVENGGGAAARRPLGSRARPRGPIALVAETAKGKVDHRGALEAAVDRRPPHGGVEGDRAALLSGGRDRHDPRGRGSRAAQGGSPARATSSPPSTTWSSRPARLALRELPRANGAYRDGRFELYSRVNVGIAVAAQDALVVPTVFDADRKGLLADRARLARAGASGSATATITPPELSGGDLHRLQPRDVRDRQLLRGDQPAAGGDPRGRRDRRAARSVRDGEIVAAHLMRRQPRLRPPHPLRRRRRRIPRPGPRAPRGALLPSSTPGALQTTGQQVFCGAGDGVPGAPEREVGGDPEDARRGRRGPRSSRRGGAGSRRRGRSTSRG